MARNELGVFEAELLAALMRAGRQNYALGLAQTIGETTGRRPPSLGAVYTAMDRMTQKGFVTSYWSEPDHVRGGRRKRLYRIEAPGAAALSAYQQRLGFPEFTHVQEAY